MADAIYETDHRVSEPCEIVDPETNDLLTIGDASAIASVGEAVGFPRDDNVVPYSGPAHFTDLLVPIFRGGQLVYEAPSIPALREHLRKQLRCAPPEILRLKDPVPYKIGLERSLHELRSKLIMRVRQVNLPSRNEVIQSPFPLCRFAAKRKVSAKGAAFNAKAWGIAPGFMVSKTPALKARITSSAIETRFQR